MLICGVDNGLDGGLVILDGTKIVAREIMPTINVKDGKREYDSFNIIKIFQQFKPEHVFIERAQAMPGQGVTSMFSIGLGHGILRGILAGLALPHTLGHPRTWQSAMFRDRLVSVKFGINLRNRRRTVPEDDPRHVQPEFFA